MCTYWSTKTGHLFLILKIFKLMDLFPILLFLKSALDEHSLLKSIQTFPVDRLSDKAVVLFEHIISPPPPIQVIEYATPTHEVEDVLAHRPLRKGRCASCQLLVKWKGCRPMSIILGSHVTILQA